MEREFRAEVKSLFDDMVGRQQGELSVRDQCEHAYEELTATVNGKPVEVQAAYDGLMGIPVQTGDNVVELRYLTPGLVPGTVVGIASVTLFAIWHIAARRRSMLRDGE